MSATTTQWILELVDKITSPMRGIADAAGGAAKEVGGVGDQADKAGKKLKDMSAIDIYAISQSIGQLSDQFNNAIQPGVDFDAQMKEVEAITGITGDALEELGDNARDTAKQFGGDAPAMLESYKGVLSKLGPEVGNSAEALNEMGNDIATLSKTMKNDAVGAMNALTGSVLQFAGDVEDPTEMARIMTSQMNVMAAAAKEGSAEVPQITESIKNAGVAASQAKLSFEETNSAVQALGRGTIYGSEAGVALRNVLGKMSGIDVIPKEAVEKLEALGVNYDIVSDKTLPFTTRLRELKKAQGDATLIAQIFGTENQNAANILLNNIDYQDKMTQKITGTNTATEQANVIMSGWGETMGRVTAWFKDLGISFFSVGRYVAPFVTGISSAVMVLANLSNAKQGVMMLFNALKTMPIVSGIFTSSFAVMGGACKTLGIAIMNIPIIGWIAAIVAALIALVTYLWNTSATFRGIVTGVWEWIKAVFTNIGKFIMSVGKGILHILKGVFNPVNWFDSSYKFADGFKMITDAANQLGESVGGAYSKGKEKGMSDFYKDHPEKAPKAIAQKEAAEKKKAGVTAEATSPDGLDIKKVSPILDHKSLTKGKGKGEKEAGLVSSGGGSSIKSISQKIEVKNYFTVSEGSNMEAVAEKVMRAINDRLRDGIVTI